MSRVPSGLVLLASLGMGPALRAPEAPAVAPAAASAVAPAPAPAPTLAPAPSARDTGLQEALAVYQQRADEAKHKLAQQKLAALAGQFPKDYELQIWCARTSYYYAHRRLQAGDSDTCSQIANQGVRCAKRAREIDPRGYEGRYWWVMDRVKAGTSTGIRAALKAVKPMKEFLEKMIADFPQRFEAYMCLGVLYRELPSFISWGDDEKALEYLKKAEALGGKNPELLLEIAEAYLKNGDDRTAIDYFQKVESSDVPTHMEWETDDARQWARKRIKDIRD